MEAPETTPNATGKDVFEIQSAYQNITPLLQNGDSRTAIPRLLELAGKFPHSAQIQNDLGVLYYQSGDPDRALVHYQKAVSLDPKNVTFLKNLADFFLVAKGDIEQSLTLYNQILVQNPADVETLSAIAQICLSLERYEDASFFFNRILEIEPWNQTAWKALEALSSSESKAKKVTENGTLRLEEVQQYLKEGKTQEAVGLLESMARMDPDNARLFNDLGVLYFQLGNKAKALYHYQKAVGLESENAAYNKNLADFYLVEMDEIEEALKLYLKVLRQHPEDVETLFALGHVCIRLEKLEDARFFYNRILDIEPWNLNAQEMLDALKVG